MSEAVFEERFVKLVKDNGGFEYYQAYRGDVDLMHAPQGLPAVFSSVLASSVIIVAARSGLLPPLINRKLSM